jgi:hypothetical protein
MGFLGKEKSWTPESVGSRLMRVHVILVLRGDTPLVVFGNWHLFHDRGFEASHGGSLAE